MNLLRNGVILLGKKMGWEDRFHGPFFLFRRLQSISLLTHNLGFWKIPTEFNAVVSFSSIAYNRKQDVGFWQVIVLDQFGITGSRICEGRSGS